MKPTPPAACSAEPIDLRLYDAQSELRLYRQYACRRRRGTARPSSTRGITSASREAIRPVLREHRTLYFYNTQYEGGVCDRNIVCTGSTPRRPWARLVPEIMRAGEAHLHPRRRLQLRPDHRALGDEIRARTAAARRSQRTSSPSTRPISGRPSARSRPKRRTWWSRSSSAARTCPSTGSGRRRG